MDKRTMLLGDYDTAADGLWTLKEWSFPEPEEETTIVDVPGRWKGPLDLSTAMTDGEPVYKTRPLTVKLESSEGDRLARRARIRAMVNKLHGRRVDIVLPDDPDHYITGRLSLKETYNDLAHCAIQVTGTCEPWRYAMEETVYTLTASATAAAATLRNDGTMPVIPLLEVAAPAGSSILLQYAERYSWALSSGLYELPDLLLTNGDHVVTYSGAGTLTITYREAVL